MTPPQMHAQQFMEMLRIAKTLPAGNWSKPSKALALEWFYMLFHKINCNKFVTVGKKLKTKHQKWFYAPYCIVEMFFQLI
jgi:hypothetical protein